MIARTQRFFGVLALGAASFLGGCGDDEDPTNNKEALSAYERLGGKEGVRAFTTQEVNKVLADPILVTYFFNQVKDPIPAGKPSAAQIIECFSRLVGSVVGAETYPGEPVSDRANKNTPNFTCRDMKAAHAGLQIGDKTFDAFVGVLAADLGALVVKDVAPEDLKAGQISQAEFDLVAEALVGTKTAIVERQEDAPQPFPGE